MEMAQIKGVRVDWRDEADGENERQAVAEGILDVRERQIGRRGVNIESKFTKYELELSVLIKQSVFYYSINPKCLIL